MYYQHVASNEYFPQSEGEGEEELSLNSFMPTAAAKPLSPKPQSPRSPSSRASMAGVTRKPQMSAKSLISQSQYGLGIMSPSYTDSMGSFVGGIGPRPSGNDSVNNSTGSISSLHKKNRPKEIDLNLVSQENIGSIQAIGSSPEVTSDVKVSSPRRPSAARVGKSSPLATSKGAMKGWGSASSPSVERVKKNCGYDTPADSSNSISQSSLNDSDSSIFKAPSATVLSCSKRRGHEDAVKPSSSPKRKASAPRSPRFAKLKSPDPKSKSQSNLTKSTIASRIKSEKKVKGEATPFNDDALAKKKKKSHSKESIKSADSESSLIDPDGPPIDSETLRKSGLQESLGLLSKAMKSVRKENIKVKKDSDILHQEVLELQQRPERMVGSTSKGASVLEQYNAMSLSDLVDKKSKSRSSSVASLKGASQVAGKESGRKSSASVVVAGDLLISEQDEEGKGGMEGRFLSQSESGARLKTALHKANLQEFDLANSSSVSLSSSVGKGSMGQVAFEQLLNGCHFADDGKSQSSVSSTPVSKRRSEASRKLSQKSSGTSNSSSRQSLNKSISDIRGSPKPKPARTVSRTSSAPKDMVGASPKPSPVPPRHKAHSRTASSPSSLLKRDEWNSSSSISSTGSPRVGKKTLSVQTTVRISTGSATKKVVPPSSPGPRDSARENLNTYASIPAIQQSETGEHKGAKVEKEGKDQENTAVSKEHTTEATEEEQATFDDDYNGDESADFLNSSSSSGSSQADGRSNNEENINELKRQLLNKRIPDTKPKVSSPLVCQSLASKPVIDSSSSSASADDANEVRPGWEMTEEMMEELQSSATSRVLRSPSPELKQYHNKKAHALDTQDSHRPRAISTRRATQKPIWNSSMLPSAAPLVVLDDKRQSGDSVGVKELHKNKMKIEKIFEDTSFEWEAVSSLLHEFEARAMTYGHKLTYEEFKDSMQFYVCDSFGNPRHRSVYKRIFEMFDTSENGHIDFFEYSRGMNRLLKGGLADHADFMFDLFDLKGDGVITRDEIIKLVRATFDVETRPVECEERIVQFMEVFRQLDEDGDKALSRNEFMRGLKYKPFLMYYFEDIRDELPVKVKERQAMILDLKLRKLREAMRGSIETLVFEDIAGDSRPSTAQSEYPKTDL
eukprot:Nk52_evm5s309 gene=Nk52_evmTU5s309